MTGRVPHDIRAVVFGVALIAGVLPGCTAAADDSGQGAEAAEARETEALLGSGSRIEVTTDTQVVAVPDP
jgi:hypothetical protein